jgi:hypothetical protein
MEICMHCPSDTGTSTLSLEPGTLLEDSRSLRCTASGILGCHIHHTHRFAPCRLPRNGRIETYNSFEQQLFSPDKDTQMEDPTVRGNDFRHTHTIVT